MTSVSLHTFPLRSSISRSQLSWYPSAATEMNMKRPAPLSAGRFCLPSVRHADSVEGRLCYTRLEPAINEQGLSPNGDSPCSGWRRKIVGRESVAACGHATRSRRARDWSECSWTHQVTDTRLECGRVPEPVDLLIGPHCRHHRATRHVPEAGQAAEIDRRVLRRGAERFDRFGELSAACENQGTLGFESRRALTARNARPHRLL